MSRRQAAGSARPWPLKINLVSAEGYFEQKTQLGPTHFSRHNRWTDIKKTFCASTFLAHFQNLSKTSEVWEWKSHHTDKCSCNKTNSVNKTFRPSDYILKHSNKSCTPFHPQFPHILPTNQWSYLLSSPFYSRSLMVIFFLTALEKPSLYLYQMSVCSRAVSFCACIASADSTLLLLSTGLPKKSVASWIDNMNTRMNRRSK